MKKQVDIKNAQIVARNEYIAVLNTIIKSGLCPFCEENLMKYHTQPILFKGKYWIVTKNAWPYGGTKHHFLLISRLHATSLEAIPKESLVELHKYWKKLYKTYNLKGASLLIRSGSTALTGASVNHLHAQIIVGKHHKKDSKAITAVVGFK